MVAAALDDQKTSRHRNRLPTEPQRTTGKCMLSLEDKVMTSHCVGETLSYTCLVSSRVFYRGRVNKHEVLQDIGVHDEPQVSLECRLHFLILKVEQNYILKVHAMPNTLLNFKVPPLSSHKLWMK